MNSAYGAVGVSIPSFDPNDDLVTSCIPALRKRRTIWVFPVLRMILAFYALFINLFALIWEAVKLGTVASWVIAHVDMFWCWRDHSQLFLILYAPILHWLDCILLGCWSAKHRLRTSGDEIQVERGRISATKMAQGVAVPAYVTIVDSSYVPWVFFTVLSSSSASIHSLPLYFMRGYHFQDISFRHESTHLLFLYHFVLIFDLYWRYYSSHNRYCGVLGTARLSICWPGFKFVKFS
jgi:hypothetical protein